MIKSRLVVEVADYQWKKLLQICTPTCEFVCYLFYVMSCLLSGVCNTVLNLKLENSKIFQFLHSFKMGWGSFSNKVIKQTIKAEQLENNKQAESGRLFGKATEDSVLGHHAYCLNS